MTGNSDCPNHSALPREQSSDRAKSSGDAAKVRAVLWLMPVSLLLHDAEELAFLPSWCAAHADLPARLSAFGAPGRVAARSLDQSFAQAAVAVALVVACAFAATLMAYRRPGGRALLVFEILTGCVFLHGFVHVAQAILLRGYVPGLFGVFLFLLPLNLLLYRRLLREGILSVRRAVATGLCGIAFFLPAVFLARGIGALFAP